MLILALVWYFFKNDKDEDDEELEDETYVPQDAMSYPQVSKEIYDIISYESKR